MLKFSVIIPIYNEEESIEPLYFSLKKVMDALKQPYEVIFVNDGSKDESLEVLNRISVETPNLAIVNLNKHSGKSVVLQAGFDIVQGELIITLDGDLQNDPEDIPKLIDKLRDGYDVVCGWRYNRKDSWDRILAAKIANTVRKIIMGERIHDVGCTLRVFKRSVLRNVYLSGACIDFFTLIMLKLGYSIGEIKVQHHYRKFGRPKYTICNRTIEGLIDLICISLFDVRRLTKRRTGYKIREIIRR